MTDHTTTTKHLGCLLPGDLRKYQRSLGLSNQDVSLLKSFDSTAEELLKGCCKAPLPKELFDLIRAFGYPIAALRMEAFDWELACLIEGYENITEMLIDFIERPGLKAQLSPAEQLLITLYTRTNPFSLGRQAEPESTFTLASLS